MMSSRLVEDRTRRHHSRCSFTSNAANRDPVHVSTPRAAPILSSILLLTTAHSRLHLTRLAGHLLRLRRATIHSHSVAKSP